MKLIPVDHDPWQPISLVPIDHDPFYSPPQSQQSKLAMNLRLPPGEDAAQQLFTETMGPLGSGPTAPAARPYKNVPDSLMGFRKNGPNKASDETNYPYEQWVHVDLGNGNSFVDAMRGLNQPHALERAYRNWEGANITPITPDQAQAGQ